LGSRNWWSAFQPKQRRVGDPGVVWIPEVRQDTNGGNTTGWQESPTGP
jgi:hypothetical protein